MEVRGRDEMRFGRDERDFVHAVARRIVRSEQAADDVTQDAMLLAFRHRDAFRGDARYRTWLYRIATTTALGYLRRGRRAHECLAPTAAAVGRDIADPTPSPEAVIGEREIVAHARRAVEQLPPRDREVVLLRVELGEAETATVLGISVANVKIRTFRARQRLRRALGRGGPGCHPAPSAASVSRTPG